MSIVLRTPYQIRLLSAATPAAEAGTIVLYAKDVGGGQVELVVRDQNSLETQLTDNGQGLNTLLHGVGAPTGGIGSDGDFYIDTSANTIYGPKTAGSWGSPSSIVGAAGTNGVGLPTGGSTGQIPTKNSNTDYDISWATPPVTSVFSRTGAVTAQSGDYTATQVGLGNVTNDAQLKRAAGDFSTFTGKSTPILADKLLIEDSAAAGVKKVVTAAELLKLVAVNVSGSGNPYIDAPFTADAWNEEFSGGDPDLANRGWTVYNFDDNTTMARVGDITGTPSSTLTAGQYRSTIHGSTLLLQVPGVSKRITVLKPCTGSYMFMVRMGVPMGNSSWGGAFITTASTPPYLTTAHNSGTGPGWQLVYIDGTPSMRYLGRTINAATFVDINVTTNVNFTFTLDTFILNHDEVTPAQYGTFVNASSMQSRGSSISGTNGAVIMATPMAMAGFAINAAFSGITASGTNIFCIDYVRRMPVNSWVGF